MYEAILAAVAAAAILCAIAITRMEKRRGYGREHTMLSSGWEGAVGYASGTVAFLLGLMLFFSVTHFSDAQSVATDEAVAYATAYDASRELSPTAAPIVQRDLACLMKATRDGAWIAMRQHDATGDENVTAWLTKTYADIAALDPATSGNIAGVDSAVSTVSQARQARVLSVQGELPASIWVIIYLSIFVLVLLLATILVSGNPLLMVVSLGATIVLSGTAIAALVMFGDPYSDLGVKVEPTAIRAVIVRLQNTEPAALWADCPTLATYQDKIGPTATP